MSKKKIEEKKNNYPRNIAILISISILTKILVFLLTPNMFHSFIDTYDINFYYDTVITPLTQGQLPYLNYVWCYPVLMAIPVFVGAIPSLVFQNKSLFFLVFPILMIICDLVTTLCVYSIALKLYNSHKRAFIAALLYATAFSAAYFVITKADAFPTCLLMVGLAYTISRKESELKGYLAIVLGFFTKIFPALILPLVVFYNSKTTGLKQEILSTLKILVPAILILVVPILIINPEALGPSYQIARQTGLEKDFFVNTPTYTVYAWLHEVLGIPVGLSTISLISYILIIAIMSVIFYFAYIHDPKDPKLLIEFSLIALFSVVAFTKFHSPQFLLWFTPLICILIAGNFVKMGLFYLLQILAFIGFPIAWNILYTNALYTSPISTPMGQITLVFFTVEYAVMFLLVWLSVEPKNLINLLRNKAQS